MTEPYAYLDGQFLPQSQAQLPLHDAGFVFGATVTDLCRTFGQRLYRWEDHCCRFRASCRSAHIDPKVDDPSLTRLAHELVHRNTLAAPPTTELCLVLFATPGPIGYYLGEPGGIGDGVATFGMNTFPLPFARYRTLIKQGADLIVPNVRQVLGASVSPLIKQRSRMHWWLADREVQGARPGAQALLVNELGHVTETAAANFLIVERGTIVSPPAGSVLDGVSVRVLRELCVPLGIAFKERPLTVNDCLAADEALLTSTPYSVAGVRSLHGTIYRFPGPLFERLRDAWSASLGMDIHAGFR